MKIGTHMTCPLHPNGRGQKGIHATNPVPKRPINDRINMNHLPLGMNACIGSTCANRGNGFAYKLGEAAWSAPR